MERERFRAREERLSSRCSGLATVFFYLSDVAEGGGKRDMNLLAVILDRGNPVMIKDSEYVRSTARAAV